MYRVADKVSEGLNAFSPRVWGCTAIRRKIISGGLSFPHACGDVPLNELKAKAEAAVFPTRVGMYRVLPNLRIP